MKINYEDKLQAQQNIINHLADKNIELQKCYDHNLSLCKWQEKRIGILADCLQEIKEIAKRAFVVCDDDCGNAIRFTDILDLITKAEEE